MSKRKAYGDSPAASEDDSDFDDDEDPDNLEVPGGGKTLAAAARMGDKAKTQTTMPVIVKATTNPLAAPSGLAFGQASNIKPIKISSSSLSKPINFGIGRGVPSGSAFPQASNMKPIKISGLNTLTKPIGLDRAMGPVAPFAAGSNAYNAVSLLSQS